MALLKSSFGASSTSFGVVTGSVCVLVSYRTVRVVLTIPIIGVVGSPHKSASGEVGMLATEVPQLSAPSLHQVPRKLDDAQTRARQPHVDMLVNAEVLQTMKIRSSVEQHLASFFEERAFARVSTPILTAGAGGAVARPFETVASELEGTKLNLRIAPELWLKRLIVGGMGKIYEIGPAFRNEGMCREWTESGPWQ